MCVTWALGGLETYPVGLEWTSWSVPATLLLFGLWWTVQPQPRAVLPGGLLLLPWVAYLAVSWGLLSPAPWRAAVDLSLWLQAAALLFVVTQATRVRPVLGGLLITLALVGFVAAFLAIYQYFIFPGWLPLGRVQVAQYLDRASGPFGVPNSLAGMMLLLLPLSLAVAAMRRYGAPLRIGAGMVGVVMLIALVVTASRGAWIGLLAVLVVSPLMLFERRKYRLRAWGFGVLGLLALGGLMWLTNNAVQDRLLAALHLQPEVTRPVMWETAWRMFKANPVVGLGASSYAVEFERYRPPLGFFAPAYAHCEYLQVLGEFGVLGFVLLFVPLGWALWRGWRHWFSLPYHRLSQEAAFRALSHDVHSMHEEEKRRHIRRRRRTHAHGTPAPAAKVLLAGLLPGLCAFFLHMAFEFHLHLAALVFTMAVLLAVTLRLSEGKRWEFHGRWSGIAGFGVAWLVAGGIFAFSLPAVRSQVLAFQGREQRQAVLGQQEIGLDAAVRGLHQADLLLTLSTDLQPGNSDAWAERGSVLLDIAYRLPIDSARYGKEGLDLVEHAIALHPGNWSYWCAKGRALTVLRAPVADVEAAYRKAIELAPNTPVTWGYLATYLKDVPGRKDDAMAAAQHALELNPNYTPAQEARRDLMLK